MALDLREGSTVGYAGKSYRVSHRRAEVGDLVKIVAIEGYHSSTIGEVTVVTEQDDAGWIKGARAGGWLHDDDYVVLEPTANPAPTPPSDDRILDVVSRLTVAVNALNSRMDERNYDLQLAILRAAIPFDEKLALLAKAEELHAARIDRLKRDLDNA